MAPTTLLARQHFKTFTERFAGCRSRCGSCRASCRPRTRRRREAGLADGTVEIVVGTHALLAKSVEVQATSGCWSIDEEQHFGVAHKERLKALRADVHVLTLTATPIPRTLQMALSGRARAVADRDAAGRPAGDPHLSSRRSIRCGPRGAAARELSRRAGFYVVPRIADLADVEDFLREQVPEVKFVVAHGQMAAERARRA